MINFKFQMESPLISHFIIVEMERASFALFCSSTKNLEITLTGLTGKIVGTIPLQPKLFQHHKKQTFQNISFHTWNHNLPIIICQFYLLYTEGRLTFLYCIRYVYYLLLRIDLVNKYKLSKSCSPVSRHIHVRRWEVFWQLEDTWQGRVWWWWLF